MNMKLKKLLDDIQKTEDKIAELQEHLKRQNTLRQQMEDIEIVKSFRSMKLDSRKELLRSRWMRTVVSRWRMQKLRRKRKTTQKFIDHLLVR